MPPTRILRPILGASSRLLQQQWSNCLAPGGKLAAALAVPRSQASKAPSTCSICSSFHIGRQLRFSSSKPPPPEPPNFDHLKPEDKTQRHPNFDHLRPVEEKPKPPPSPPPQSRFDSEASKSPSSSTSPPETATSQNTSPTGSQSDPNLKDESETVLPSHSESQRSRLSTAFTSFMDQAQSQLFVASQRINDLTGYSGIETLKNQISDLETGLSRAQETLHTSRTAYKTAVADRAATQREVTTLLARQKTWTPADFERFTALYRTDYELDASVADRARELEEAEREAERINRELSAGILARYHEEQIWSDKIRRMSTWGTWGLMGVNILLFFMFQFGAEPWRRARLVKGFEEKVREAIAHEREKEKAERIEVLGAFFGSGNSSVNATAAAITPAQASVSASEDVPAEVSTEDVKTVIPVETRVVGDEPPVAVAEAPEVSELSNERPPMPWREIFTTTTWWKETAADLTSERKVAVRMRDVSVLALEGAAAGAAIAGTIAFFFIRKA